METKGSLFASHESGLCGELAELLLDRSTAPIALFSLSTGACIGVNSLGRSAYWSQDHSLKSSASLPPFLPLCDEQSETGFAEWLRSATNDTRYWSLIAKDSELIVRLNTEIIGEGDERTVVVTTLESIEDSFIDEFHRIDQETRTYIGQEYFVALVKTLGSALGCNFACATTISNPQAAMGKTIAAIKKDRVFENFEYNLKHSPCEQVLGSRSSLYAPRVQEQFPKDEILVELGAVSYLGVPMTSLAGETVGLLAFMSDKPMIATRSMRWLLEIFAVRAAAELERMRAESELAESRKRFEALFRLAPDAILLIGTAGKDEKRIVDANDLARKMYALEPERSEGCYLWDICTSARQEESVIRWQRVIDGERVVFETRVTPPGKQMIPIEITAEAIELDGQRYVLAFHRDITQRRSFEETLRKREAELAHTGRFAVLGEAIAEIAHEINQPIYAIKNYAEASRLEIDSQETSIEKLGERLKKIDQLASNSSAIIQRIREFLRREQKEISNVSLKNVADEAVEIATCGSLENLVSVAHDGPLEELLVLGDKLQLQQVVVNLVKNALEANGEGRDRLHGVQVHTMCRAGYVRVSITDSGEGIPQEIGSAIFDPFYSTKPNGMGMGLSIAKTIVESHDGRIWYSSGIEGRTQFHFELPKAKQSTCTGE